MTEEREDVISRWSRLKQRDKQVRPRAETAPSETSGAPREGGDLVPGDDQHRPATVAQLPDIESMDESSDFTVFLKEGVPEALRRRALRKLWRLDPVFANLDGLNEYDEDFTIVTTLAENLKTVYQVGKGMPDPEPVETQDADEFEPSDVGETTDLNPSPGESEPDHKLDEIESETPMASESPGVADLTTQAGDADSEEFRSRSRTPGSSAAWRRWSGLKS